MEPTPAAEPLPARMVNAFVFCPRLFWLEHVEGVFVDNEHTVRGQHEHRRVDKPGGKLAAPPAPSADGDPAADGADATTDASAALATAETAGAEPVSADAPPWHSRALWLGSDRLGVSARLDLVDERDGEVLPVDTKKGRSDGGKLWAPDRVQLVLQALLLREHGYNCRNVAAFYVEERRRVVATITADDEREALAAVAAARACAAAPRTPPPLVDSPKCFGCSLNVVCLPDEVLALSDPPRQPDDATPGNDGDGQVLDAAARHAGDDDAIPARTIRRVVPVRDDALPLYVQAYNATVGLSGECLRVTVPGKDVVEVGLAQTSQVNIYGTAKVTTQALQQCLSRDIPVAWFTTRGWLYGLTTSAESRQVHIRVAQFREAEGPRGLAIARTLIADKIANQRTMLRRNGDSDAAVLDQLRDACANAAVAPSAAQLLGHEGAAARAYWTAFGALLDDRWRPTKRTRRPPEDPVNAMLSFGYALLVKDCQLAARTAGLDPFFGVFHTAHHGRPSLALDLMEPFRPLVVDSTVLVMIKRGEVKLDDFVWTGQAVAMKQGARQALIRGYERRMDELLTHPTFGYRISYRQTIGVQARLLARALAGEVASIPSIRTR